MVKIVKRKKKKKKVKELLALKYYQAGDLKQAEYTCKEILKVQPDNYDILNILGNVYLDIRRFDLAITCFQKIVQLNPNSADAYAFLGQAFLAQNEMNKALESYNQALIINHNSIDALHNKGFILEKQGKLVEAVENYLLSLRIKPDSVEGLNNIGNLLKDMGQLNEADIYYKRALQINPTHSIIYSNLLLSMNYNAKYNALSIFTEHLNFAKRCAESFYSNIASYTNERRVTRSLRIGYVSPDFRKESVGFFIESVLASHNHQDFEIFCYHNLLVQDEMTERMKAHANNWRNIVGMSDEKVVELIHEDEIDILVDLIGHTRSNRILVFARKPAPIQVTWLGYPNTTGLSTMDYRIVDNFTDPPGMTEEFNTENLIRLPGCFLCYLPDKNSPDVMKLPAHTKGYVTFGTFNTLAKVSPETIILWSKILKRIPNSKLIMKTQSLSDQATHQYLKNQFLQHGVTEERLELLSWVSSFQEHLEIYNRIDIVLDTFPYNGTTNTCEAMWMGVPVVTLEGNTHVSRVGVSLLSNVGLTDLIAKTQDEYIEKSVQLANDIEKLHLLRERLRGMMTRSPLTDSKQFTINLENFYRQMWETYCKST